MARPKTIISKAELAEVLHLTRGRISQLYAREDFPKRVDGRVDRDVAVRWYESVGLAQQSLKRGPKPKRKPAPTDITTAGKRRKVSAAFREDRDYELPDVEFPERYTASDMRAHGVASQRELFDTLVTNSARIPEMALRFGLNMPQAIAAGDAFRSLVLVLADGIEDQVYDWLCDDIPHAEHDAAGLAALAKKFNLAGDPAEWQRQADELGINVDAVVWENTCRNGRR